MIFFLMMKIDKNCNSYPISDKYGFIVLLISFFGIVND